MDGSPDRPHRAGAPGYGPSLPVVSAVVVSALSAEQWQLLENRGNGLVPFGLAASDCPRKMDYCKWVMDHENAKSTPQFKDLAAFLRVFKAVFPSHADEPVFPGSQIARVFKSK